jgi:ankyrin repeat protein
LAAQNGHDRVVKLLMQKGALVYKSFTGNNPFHEAALNGFTNCMKIIYNNDPYILNSENKQKVS